MQMDIERENLAGKIVLEVGSGRGDTTRRLVELLSRYPDATLLATDVSDAHFDELRDECRDKRVRVEFVRTDACELAGIADISIDYIVCNYTLCAIDARAGAAVLALRKFSDVLKPGGRLFVEEEFPINESVTPEQEIWAGKWRALKSATILASGLPFAEFSPDTLSALCRLVGFEKVEWTKHAERLADPNVLDFFQRRFDALLPKLPSDDLRAGFSRMAAELKEQARQVGGMEIPYYRLTARK